jgi:type I restriction enzyme, S subunit
LLRAVFIDLYGDPMINPKGWPVYKMGDVIDFKGGSQPPKETFVDEERPGYVRLVQIRDFKTDKYKTFIPAHLAKRAFDVDDVMIARYGPPVFQILRGLSGSYNVALMKAQPKADILKEIIYWLLQLPAYHDVVVANSERTAGQSGVNLDLLNKLLVPLPPPSVQLEIAKQTTRITALIKKQEEMLRLQEAQCKALQASLLG